MLVGRLSLTKYLLHRHGLNRLLTTVPTSAQPPPPVGPVNETQLLKVCTILYQQQDSPDTKLHSKLSSCDFDSTHEFFLQVCNKFPYSWRPVYRFFLYTHQQKTHQFSHTPVTYNKMLSVIAQSRNIELLWSVAREMGKLGFVNVKTHVIVVKTLALAREMKKCVAFFHLMEVCGYGYCVDRFNSVIRVLCREKLVVEAKYVVMKMKEWVRIDGVTYGLLVKGFCDVGDLIEACKIWNLMVDGGFDVGVDVFEKMMETFFKRNEDGEAMKLFEEMRIRRIDDLGVSTYGVVIHWLCKRGKISQAKVVFDEMCERGFEADNSILGSVVYGLLVRRRVDEAYKVVEGIERLDINVYHALIKGLLRLKRPSEATQIFREMIKRGCEPTMHTYIMLLQGHLGKRGRKEKDPVVNFDTIFVGGLVQAGKLLEATKFVERLLMGGVEVPRFDYCKFLHYFSSEEGVVMFEEVSKKLKEAGMVDLADILQRYGEKMATRDRRRNRAIEPIL